MDLRSLKDDELLTQLKTLVRQEREETASVIAHLAEVDHRDLARERGYPSLFEYCLRELGYSEASAYHRIRAARAIRKRPDLLDMLRRGELHLRALVLLHPYLDDPGADGLIERVRGKTQREVKAILAPLSPQPPTHDVVRVISIRPPSAEDLPLFSGEPVDGPAEPAQTRVAASFQGGPLIMDLLERARALMRHKFPDGRLEDVVGAALEALLSLKDPDRWPISQRRDCATRKIPRWIRREVWRRDHGRCSFAAPDGRRCGSRSRLEFDHVIPWSLGGTSNDPANIRLLCAGHNRVAARQAGLDLWGSQDKTAAGAALGTS